MFLVEVSNSNYALGVFCIPRLRLGHKKHRGHNYYIMLYDTVLTDVYMSGFSILHYYIGVIKCSNYALGVFCARGAAEGYKTHRGHNYYLILQQGT